MPCPTALILDDARNLTAVGPGANGRPTLGLNAQITGVSLFCEYEDTFSMATSMGSYQFMQVKMDVTIDATRGPAYRDKMGDVELVVAVTNRLGTPVSRGIIETGIDFDGRTRATVVEPIWQRYNLDEMKYGGRGDLYLIWVGFQLTREQLDYNRRVSQ